METQHITDLLTFLRRSKALQSAERYRCSLRNNRNSVADHSWRVALMALTISADQHLDLDVGHALALAVVHDLPESLTGDIDAYRQIQEGKRLIDEKAVLEENAMRDLTGGLFFGQSVYDLWREYEAHETKEAKFVHALDSIEGFLHIAEEGVDAYIPKEFHADYANRAVRAFDEVSGHLPELGDFLEAIRSELKVAFAKAGVAWVTGSNETSSVIRGG